MLKIKDVQASDEVLEFLKSLKDAQKEIKNDKMVYYPSISLYLSLKYKIFSKGLLLHPVILDKKNFYDEKNNAITIPELVEKLAKVLSYEFTSDEPRLSDIEIKQIIKVHKKLKETIEKSNVL